MIKIDDEIQNLENRIKEGEEIIEKADISIDKYLEMYLSANKKLRIKISKSMVELLEAKTNVENKLIICKDRFKSLYSKKF